MASIHIIYDPHEKLSTNPELNRALDLAYAIIPIPPRIESGERGADLRDFTSRALDLFMENFDE